MTWSYADIAGMIDHSLLNPALTAAELDMAHKNFASGSDSDGPKKLKAKSKGKKAATN